MKVLSAAAQAVLSGSLVPLVVLIEMDLTTPLNLNTSNLDLVVSGTTYYGTKGVGTIEPIQETDAEVRGLSFELSGVPSTMLALAMLEPVQGKAVRIKVAMLDPATYQVVDVRQRWAGMLDTMTIEESETSSTIKVSAEHAGIDLLRPITSLYSDAEQQRLYPGDLSLQYISDQSDQQIVWPAADWFRK